MIHYGAAGVFGAPRQEQREPDADCFRIGDEWKSPKGIVYRVVRAGGQTVHLLSLSTRRLRARQWDDIGAHSGRPWVRLSYGLRDGSNRPAVTAKDSR